MSGPTRILVPCPSAFVSGAEHSTLSLMKHLDPTRYHAVAAVPDGSRLQQRCTKAGIETAPIRPVALRRTKPLAGALDLVGLGRDLTTLIGRLNVPLVHAATTVAALGAAIPCRRRGTKLIWHVRDRVAPHPLLRALGRRLDAAIAISHTVADPLDELLPAPRRAEVIYNGIDEMDVAVDATREEVRRGFGLSMDTPLVIVVGQLVAWKRIDRVVELFAHVTRCLPDACLLIVGSSPAGPGTDDESAIDRTIDHLGLGDRTVKLGYRHDVPSLVAAADVFVSAARCEPLGRAVMEAMWLGTPVVLSHEGGHLELIEPDQSGLTFDADNPDEGARQVLAVLGDAGLAGRLSDAASHRIRTRFSARAAAEATMNLYDRLLETDRPS